jgi:hypothetical protein
MQAAEVQRDAARLAELTRLEPARSHHPDSGPRPDRDDMLNLIDSAVIPRGEGPSIWPILGEFSRVAEFLNANGAIASADSRGLAVEFPFGETPGPAILGGRSALLTVETRDRHPVLGHGLALRLHLPLRAEDGRYDEWPLRLNEKERDSATAADFLGSWCIGPHSGRKTLLFTCFVPAYGARPGLLSHLVLTMGLRARWAQETLSDGEAWPRGVEASSGSLYGAADSDGPVDRLSADQEILMNCLREVIEEYRGDVGHEQTRGPGKARKPSRRARRHSDLVYGVAGEDLIFIDRGQAKELAACHEAWGEKGGATWGQLRAKISPSSYRKLLDLYRRHRESFYVALCERHRDSSGSGTPEEDRPIVCEGFDPISDGDWPGWPQQDMLSWVPGDIVEEFGERSSSFVSGDCLVLDRDRVEEIVAAFESHGFTCAKGEKLVKRACGYL